MKTFYLATIALTFLLESTYSQTTRTVCPSGCDFTTIQAAVTAATSGDVILINYIGAFTEKGITLPEKNLTIKGLGKTTTILQAAATRTNAAGGRIFTYTAPTGAGGNAITFEDMTIRYAYAPLTDFGSGLYQSIGGVFLAQGTLKGLTVTANRVKFYANETTAGNSLNSGGACFYISGTGSGYTYNADLIINNCDFDDNKAGNSVGTSLTDGPCFNLLGSPNRITINNCNFTNNSAYTRGGVMYVGSSWTVNVSNSLFESNTARNGDGGCFSAKSGSSYTFDNCLFKNNSAVYLSAVNGNNGWGGVIIGRGAKFNNCTFYGNSAVKGGAICRTSGSEELQLLNCTFYGNSASSTGNTIQYGSTVSASTTYPLVLVNTIITNGAGTAPSEIHFTFPYANLTTNSKTYCNSISTENGTPGTTPVFEFNSGNCTPGISSTLADNGGPTQTLALQSNSSFINAGTTAKSATYDIAAKDQRNYARTDAGIDIGAYEYNGITDDATAPVITSALLGNTTALTDRTISATITDVNGIYWYSQLQDLRPAIYFRKNNGTWNSSVGTLASGTGQNGVWNFMIASAAMGGVTDGDKVDYYIVTQDVSTAPSVTSFPAGVAATSVAAITSPPTPGSYLIGTSLPVTLLTFSVNKNEDDVTIKWTVAEEASLSHYEVERSTDGIHWSVIGTVKAANLPAYSLIDKNLEAGTYYYRLRSVDIDGAAKYGPVKMIRNSQPEGVKIYPNPVFTSTFTIELKAGAPVYLYTNEGMLIWKKQLSAGTHQINVTGLSKGVYKVITGKTAHSILIK